MEVIKLYLLTTVVFLGIDMVWLTVVAKNFYAKHIGFLMTESPNIPAALIFYLMYVVGILVFAVLPGLSGHSLNKTIILGALFGFLAYATYDLTNLATIKNWPMIITVIDILWGTAITSFTALAGFLIGKNILKM